MAKGEGANRWKPRLNPQNFLCSYDIPVNIPEENEEGAEEEGDFSDDDEEAVRGEGADPVAMAQALGVYSGKPDRPFWFFTYGTLKQGFANRGKFEEALEDFAGPRVTKDSLPLVVPTLPSCTNAGCRLLHRACTLVDA
jgi:hypothetical protein